MSLLPSQFRLSDLCHEIVSYRDDAHYMGGSWAYVYTGVQRWFLTLVYSQLVPKANLTLALSLSWLGDELTATPKLYGRQLISDFLCQKLSTLGFGEVMTKYHRGAVYGA